MHCKILHLRRPLEFKGRIYLRPTAACFLSDRSSIKVVTRIARPHRSIVPIYCQRTCPRQQGYSCRSPRFARCLPLLSGIPVNWQPPKSGSPCLVGTLKSCGEPVSFPLLFPSPLPSNVAGHRSCLGRTHIANG